MRVVAVDWSGRASGERAHLWVAEIDDGEPARLAPATRADAVDRLVSLAENDDRLVAGLDFGFSLPAWFLRREGFASAPELWAAEDRLASWLAECRPPFWGRPRTRRPAGVELLRVTERQLRPQPKSVFQIGGAGTVGTGSLRGMPALARLRAAGFAVWPFDPPRLPLVVEMWPRLLTVPAAVKSRAAARSSHPMVPPAWQAAATASEDAFDAAVAAVGMDRRVAELVALPTLDGDIAQLEGWIWGAPLPGSPPRPPADPTPDKEFPRRVPNISGKHG